MSCRPSKVKKKTLKKSSNSPLSVWEQIGTGWTASGFAVSHPRSGHPPSLVMSHHAVVTSTSAACVCSLWVLCCISMSCLVSATSSSVLLLPWPRRPVLSWDNAVAISVLATGISPLPHFLLCQLFFPMLAFHNALESGIGNTVASPSLCCANSKAFEWHP